MTFKYNYNSKTIYENIFPNKIFWDMLYTITYIPITYFHYICNAYYINNYRNIH